MNNFAAIGPLQYVAIAITGVFLTGGFLFFLLREQKAFKASDGKAFSSEEACRAYEVVLDRVQILYEEDEQKSSELVNFGFQVGFLKLLKSEGFSDPKKLMMYRDDFGKLVNIFNQADNM